MSPSRRAFFPTRATITAAVMVAAGFGVATGAPPAHASDLRMTVEKPHFICEKGGVALSHVAFHPGQKRDLHPSLPCCDGQLGCAQFLSTSTVLHPARHWHS